MRHQFLRLFFSIMAIVVVLILVQVSMLLIGNYRIAMDWRNRVFEEFALTVQDAIWQISSADDAAVFNLMLQNTSERISGLLIRDGNGEFVATIGRSPMGKQLPTPGDFEMRNAQIANARMQVAYQDEISYRRVKVESPRYEIALTTTGGALPLLRGVAFRPMAPGSSSRVELPEALDDQDIAGTIAITIDGVTRGYIDVLVFRFNYYAPTAFALEGILAVFFIFSMPLALIISIVLAAVVSKRTERSVKGIQNALYKLSRGEFDISFPRQHTEEMRAISESIATLAKDLERHQRSRKEWIRNISHDLNTPVTSLSILINGAIDGIFPIDEKLLSSLKRENDTLSERIASVGYYSFLLSPDAKADKEEVSVRSLASDTLASKGLSCALPDNDIEAYADPSLLSRALCEVVRNADAYRTGDDVPLMALRIGGDGSSVIEVRNRGSLPKPLPQFFEPWARGDESRTSGGSGLGLPIVYQIMELHSGSVMIAESGAFVTVTLKFPKRP